MHGDVDLPCAARVSEVAERKEAVEWFSLLCCMVP